MKRSLFKFNSFILAAGLAILISGCVEKIQNTSLGMDAAKDTLKAATLSEDEVKTQALKAREYLDSKNKVTAHSSPYSKRLEKIVKNLKKYDDLDLNYKVYITEEINAFALADGSIRVNSGLMDMMLDGELLYIIGHEIGHVKLGHHKKSLQMAYAASAARKGAASTGGTAGTIAASSMGGFAEKLINAQFSQAEEKDADDYGLKFLKAQNKKGDGAVNALKKLVALGNSNHSIFSSHPEPEQRAKRLMAQL